MKMNRVQLIGRIARQLELKFIDTKDGKKAVCNFILAVTKKYANKDGEYQADFIPCVVWGKPAENLCKHQVVGSLIAVTGGNQTRQYDDKNGNKIYTMEVLADDIQYLESKGSRSAAKQGHQPQQQENQQSVHTEYVDQEAPIYDEGAQLVNNRFGTNEAY
ncbi:single-stranded DNA-binding protein [Listeria booriae]|uniref:Single-stranded DNA-binding protein n=1 Tax=Listeria booriae TaxID=1552123 RepID=A0A841Y4B7_9LIST|nr:single-stranded DNA-binding protein [Listeria booriae]MBC1318497.1 single-stranded DNA-binding protein [Listeria booriae]MBC2388806.1 single-stranded DNA-binding protein [Listeria booriae]